MSWTSTKPEPGAFANPCPQVTKLQSIVAPKGVNQVDPLAEFPVGDAISMINMYASRYGTKVRPGFQLVTSIGVAGDVRTIIPYSGTISSKDRLFAVSDFGIAQYVPGVAIPRIFFPTITTRTGWGVWTAFTTVAGFFSVYGDEEYGYYLYTESTDAWTRPTTSDVTGVDPALLVAPLIFKSRIWFVQRDTSDAWYLPTGAITGAATKFAFGNKFRHGGTLQALYTWTLDGGIGVDDYLIAISSTGEVIVYKGDDPSDATNFSQVGSWFIGNVPIGRRIAGSFGGDLYLLSVYGLLPISKLIMSNVEQVDTIELTRKISPEIRNKMLTTLNTRGWEVKLIPQENLLMIMSPNEVGKPKTQYVQSLNAQGWSILYGLPCQTGEVWQGTFYMGDQLVTSGRGITIFSGAVDSDLFNQAIPIVSSCITGFQDMDAPGQYHTGMFIRPVFLAASPPTVDVSIRYDYNIADVVGTPTGTVTAGSVWDVALWDLGVWSGDLAEAEVLRGAGGMGRAMAVAMNMSTSFPTTLIRLDVMYETGGFM